MNCEGLEKWSSESNLFRHNGHSDKDNNFTRYFEPALSDVPLVEFIVDNSNMSSKSCSKNIRKICDYTKIPFNIIDIDSWNKTYTVAPTTRVISLYDSKKLSDVSILKLMDFVSKGGTLFISYANQDSRMSFLYGFSPLAEYAINSQAKGWFLTSSMLPSLEGKSFMENEIHYGFSASNFSSSVKILATAINDSNYPLIVENKVGVGRVILFNTTKDFIKSDRGLFFSAILKGLEAIPYPVANTATIFLDDFPSPQYNLKAEPIKSELDISMSDFVKKVWWPDMIGFSTRYKIPYSVMLTFDYRNQIVPPFTFDQWNENKIRDNRKLTPLSEWFVKDAKKHNYELAFHGYNHVSLTINDWKNQDYIGTSLKTIAKKWELSEYGAFPTTYVPPSNIIDKYGLKELKKGIPSLKYMCSIYLGESNEGGNREFDYDPFNKDFFDYPRISSGFHLSDDNKYNIQSLYLFTGIWTHFVHPDDVFQIPNKTKKKQDSDYELRNKNSYGWYKTIGSTISLHSEFNDLLKSQTETYPQMRFLSANDASKLVIDWRASRYKQTSDKDIFTIETISPIENSKHFWFLYGSKVNSILIETQLKNQKASYKKTPFLEGYLYSICTLKSKLNMVDLDFKTNIQKREIIDIATTVKQKYDLFMMDLNSHLAGTYWDKLADKKEKAALIALKNRMVSTPEINYEDWNNYAKKMAWIKQSNEVWDMLDTHVKMYHSKNNIMYSKKLDNIIGYQNESEFEKWLYAQIQVSPNDISLLNLYISNFYTIANFDKIKEILQKIYILDPSIKNYKNYIKHLIDYSTDEVLTLLRVEDPNDNLKEFANSIVWLFVDNKEFLKAYQWAELTTDFDFLTKMNWLIDAKEYTLLEIDYHVYIELHQDDYKVKARMCEIYHLIGRFKEAWILANALPESEEKDALRKLLNKDVIFEKKELRDYLIANHSEFFYETIHKTLVKEDRLENGNYIETNSALESNQQAPAIFKNVFSYNIFDKKHNIHSLGLTYDRFYAIEVPNKYSYNFDNALVGLLYKFTTTEKFGKNKYWTLGRIQFDEKNKPFIKLGLGVNHSKETRYRSTQLLFFPVETGPALNQEIYQMRLNFYQDAKIFKTIQSVISIETDYYFEGILNPDSLYTKKEAAYHGAATVKFLLDNGKLKKSKWVPYLESQYSLGSKNLQNGFPYWMIENRLYGGVGLGWQFRTKSFYSVIDAGYFLDDFSKKFQRITSNIEYQLFDFTAITINLEAFIQSQYYSNSLNFGLKHNFKKKFKKKK